MRVMKLQPRFLFNFNIFITLSINFTKLFWLILTKVLFYISIFIKFNIFFENFPLIFLKNYSYLINLDFFYMNIQTFLLNVN